MNRKSLFRKAAFRFNNWKLRRFYFPRRKDDFKKMAASFGEDTLLIGKWQVMQEWERPLMRVMAEEVTRGGGSILEVGFGMAISATYIMEFGCSHYTVIEPHPAVLEKARRWAESWPGKVTIIEGFWQDVLDGLGRFDGILFDTFPLTREEAGKDWAYFLPRAPDHLNPGGVLTFYSDAARSLSGDILELILDRFDEVKLIKVSGLQPPPDCQYWSSSSMLVPVCRKMSKGND